MSCPQQQLLARGKACCARQPLLRDAQAVSRRHYRPQPCKCAAEGAQAELQQLLHMDDSNSGLSKLRFNKREQELPEELRGMLASWQRMRLPRRSSWLAAVAATCATAAAAGTLSGSSEGLSRAHVHGPAGLQIQDGFVIDTKSDKVLNALLDAPGSFEVAIKAARGDYDQPAGVEVRCMRAKNSTTAAC